MSKLLLVEDDYSLRSLYQTRLVAEGYTVIAAQDGEEALAVINKEHPDLVILDIMMPKLSGFDALSILRDTPSTKDIKVIMMTALSQPEDQARALKLGANRYLIKSKDTLQDFVKTVKEVLEEAPASTAATTVPTSALTNTTTTPPPTTATPPPTNTTPQAPTQ